MRVRTVMVSTFLCSLGLFLFMVTSADFPPSEALRLLGWWPVGLAEIFKSLLLTSLLFMGPLFERGVAEGEWKSWVRGTALAQSLSGWIGWRNFVAVCTFTLLNLVIESTERFPGPYHRGSNLPLPHRGSPPHGTHLPVPDRPNCTALLRNRACPPSVRVQANPSVRLVGGLAPAHLRPVQLHHDLRLVRNIRVSPDRFSPRCHPGAFVLQLLRSPSTVGSRRPGLARREHGGPRKRRLC